MSEFEKWLKTYEALANSHGFVLNDDEKCRLHHAWLAAKKNELKWRNNMKRRIVQVLALPIIGFVIVVMLCAIVGEYALEGDTSLGKRELKKFLRRVNHGK